MEKDRPLNCAADRSSEEPGKAFLWEMGAAAGEGLAAGWDGSRIQLGYVFSILRYDRK